MSIVKAVLYTLLLIILYHVIQLLIHLPIMYFIGRPDDFTHLNGIAKIIAAIGAFSIIYKIFWKQKFELLNISKYSHKIYLYLPLMAMGLFLINKPFWDLDKIMIFYQDDIATELFGFEKGLTRSFYDYISIMLIAPIIEELFFRKFLLGKLVEKNGINIALIISSLCFSLIHIETPLNLIPAFFGGILFGLVYLNTRKIGYSIMLHFLFNLIVMLTEYFGFSYNNWLIGYKFDIVYWLLFAVGIMIVLFGVTKVIHLSNVKVMK